MRTIPAALAARLESGATTLCHCWALRRRDGAALGFTDHDRDLAFGGLTYRAGSGLDAAEATTELGFAVGGGDVAGALTSAGIAPEDVAGGLYDGATVETWLVDWDQPSARILLDIGTIGEIRREGDAFVAELRGLMHQLDAERGRRYRPACDALLGDARCRIDLDDPRYRVNGTVVAALSVTRLRVELARAFDDSWFSRGTLSFVGGANANLTATIRSHRGGSETVAIDLWEAPPRPVEAGDAVRLVAGCDKRLGTCREKFDNAVNFQGFPHMPGNDFVLRYAPSANVSRDGGSLFR